MTVHRLPIPWDGHQAKAIRDSEEIRQLYRETTPLPGRPGWRVDRDGREWYSAAWLESEASA